MSRRPIRLSPRGPIALVLIACIVVSALPAQAGSTANPSSLPEPYGKDEFPRWAQALRRFEIVSLGAFPLLLSYTRLAVDIARFIGNDFAPEYTPWPFKPTNAIPFTTGEQWSCVYVAAGLSLAFGLADALIVWSVPLD